MIISKEDQLVGREFKFTGVDLVRLVWFQKEVHHENHPNE